MWPLVGRDRELGFAGELLAQRSPGGLVLAGPAGVGKTRLAVEVSQIALARGCTVEWVRATRSAAAIPLGAFAALLPPTAAAAAGDAELLARTRHALVERAGGRPLVLCVDDGHLLDHGSAALVHQLAAAGEAFAVVTVRRGAPAPDAVRALWKDELCALLELEELSPGELERVLTEALGGAVDGRSLQTLWKLTRGNALFLRELVLYGVERKALVDDGGIWRWRAEPAPAARRGGARRMRASCAPLRRTAPVGGWVRLAGGRERTPTTSGDLPSTRPARLIGLERTRVIEAPEGITHLRFRVVA